MSLAESGVLLPAVALWLPNGLFVLAAAWGMWMVVGERDVDFDGVRLRLGEIFSFRRKSA